MNKGMGGHHSSRMGKDEWLTPPWLLEKLGDFDLDPCAPVNRPWNTADKHYTIEDDGLNRNWAGRVWCNPPYGKQADAWLKRMAEHGNGIALIFARTETSMFWSRVWNKAAGVLFINGRLTFYHVSGEKAAANAGAPSALVAYGTHNMRILERAGIPGACVTFSGPYFKVVTG